MIELAAEAARPDVDRLRRAFIGAVAIRSDGVIVTARNGSSQSKSPSCHAEVRVLRKAGRGSVVFVARVLKNGRFAMAKPCATCMSALRNKDVSLVAFTTDESEYKIIRP